MIYSFVDFCCCLEAFPGSGMFSVNMAGSLCQKSTFARLNVHVYETIHRVQWSRENSARNAFEIWVVLGRRW